MPPRLCWHVLSFYTGYYGEEPVEVTRAEALAAVEDVIASGEYGLVPQFKNLWPASSAKVAEKGDYETLKVHMPVMETRKPFLR